MRAGPARSTYEKKVFADLARDRVKARLKEISEGDWAATAVKKSVEEMQAAIMVAVMIAGDDRGHQQLRSGPATTPVRLGISPA